MSKLVSIIIPVYNSERFLRRTMESAINQTYSNMEIICIDDGSTDNSLKILEEFSEKIQIITQKNQGLASSVNNAISRCKGEWIKWISPDDIMYPNCVEELVNHSENYTIVYSNWDIIDEHSKPLRTFRESDYNSLSAFDFTIRLLSGQQINVNTTLISADLFDKCRLCNLEDSVAVDYDLFLNAAINFGAKFFLVNKPLIQYRIHTNQLSHKNITETLSFLENIKKEYLNKLDDKTRIKYVKALDEYNKQKPFSKKTMEIGLSILSKIPQEISDKILVYYLNQIRKNR